MCLGMACYIKSCVVRVSNRVLCGYRYKNKDDHRERDCLKADVFARDQAGSHKHLSQRVLFSIKNKNKRTHQQQSEFSTTKQDSSLFIPFSLNSALVGVSVS